MKRIQERLKKSTKKKIHSNNKGSTLNVVLMIFVVVVLSLLSTSRLYIDLFAFHGNGRKLDKERQMEIYLKRYFRETMDTDLLLSNDFTVENTRIHYTVDDMWDYYLIVCDISDEQDKYRFEMHIKTKDLNISKFQYMA